MYIHLYHNGYNIFLAPKISKYYLGEVSFGGNGFGGKVPVPSKIYDLNGTDEREASEESHGSSLLTAGLQTARPRNEYCTSLIQEV